MVTPQDSNALVTNITGTIELKTKQSPKSGKSTGLTITNFGAIIYNNSIFRNKNISNFLHNNQVLPFIYSSKY